MINKIQFTGTLTRIDDSDWWTDAHEHAIKRWDSDREKLRELGCFVIRLTAPSQLCERLGMYVNTTTVAEKLDFKQSFEE